MSEAFKHSLANPFGMEHFDSFYQRDTSLSMHGKAEFRLSTRDMAKFGQLF
jgi:hypothetical protein